MRRRVYLTGLLTVLTGCASQQTPQTPQPAESSTPTQTASPQESTAPTKTPPGTATPVESGRVSLASNDPYRTADGWVVRLRVYHVRRGIIKAGDPQATPLVPADRQFLQVGVETRGDGAPPPEDLCLGATVDGNRPFAGCTAHLEATDPDTMGTLQAVPVPLSVTGESAAVIWDRPDGETITWGVSERILTALRNPPEFVVEALAVPATATNGESIEIGITVRNKGDREDWFVAELGFRNTSESTFLEVPYGPGSSRTVTRTLTADFGDSDELTVRLDWDLDAIERQITQS